MITHWTRIALGASLAALVWWPSDVLLYADRPEVQRAFALWRGGVILANPVLVLLVRRLDALQRHIEPVLGVGLIAQVGWIAWCLSLPPGQVDHLFPFMYPSAIFTVPMLVSLPRRVVWASLAAAAAWLGAHPTGLPTSVESWDQLSFLAFTVALGVGLGHVVYRLVLGQFVLQRRLAAREAELEALSAGLESRVAEQATVLLDLNGQAASARQRERERVARDLHDGLGQDLTGTRLLASALMAGPLPEDARQGIGELVGLLGRSHQSLRQALHDLAPEALEEHGLVAAIRGMVEETAARAGLGFELHLDPLARPVPAPVAVAVFRVAQEALSNVVQHSQARVVRVQLQLVDSALRLQVSDDGVGLPAAPAEGRSRFGLLGIQARVVALGGEVRLSGGPGTTVIVHLPLPEPT